MKYRDLAVGDTFDWINPDAAFNSFFLRCTKTSEREYIDENGMDHRVGSINAPVFHVTPKAKVK